MIDVYLTRHGQTEWNRVWRIQGRLNSPLTDEGIKGAQDLSRAIRDIDFSSCYASPRPRAMHTAHLLIGNRDIPLFPEPLLTEMDIGIWEGRYADDFAREDPDSFFAFRNRADLYQPSEGGESFLHVVERAKVFLKKIENLPDDAGPILCVSHCILLQAIMMICDNGPLSSIRTTQSVDQTALFHIRWDGSNWSVLMRNGKPCLQSEKQCKNQCDNDT